MSHQTIIVLDFGSQYTQLIARRLRELSVYSEIWPPNTPADKIRGRKPAGIILSGGPKSVSDPGAPVCDPAVFELGRAGAWHLLRHAVDGAHARRNGGPGRAARVRPRERPGRRRRARRPCCSRMCPTRSASGPATAISSPHRRPASRSSPRAPTRRSRPWPTRTRGLYALLFHPEVVHTESGLEIIRNFAFKVCGCTGDWTMKSFVQESVARIREQVGDGRVVCGAERRRRLDGGGAAASPGHWRSPDLHLRRQRRAAPRRGRADSQAVRAAAICRWSLRTRRDLFLDRLAGVTDPEQKRKIIGSTFIDVFEVEAHKLGTGRLSRPGHALSRRDRVGAGRRAVGA